MKCFKRKLLAVSMLAAILGVPLSAGAAAFVQCPGDNIGGNDAVPDAGTPSYDPNVTCMHLVAGDGFVTMADGRELYTFGFSNFTGVPEDEVLANAVLGANFSAPTIRLREGQKFYLTLSNVGTINRPDLFDPHTVHFHGFPNAASVFDGVPDASVSIGQGFSLTYFYNIIEPGTYMYHCHVEATEHMQMGMLGNLWVEPGQNLISGGTDLNGFTHVNTGDADNPPYGDFPGPGDVDNGTAGVFDEGTHTSYAYNDGDGSTRYDVQYPLQLGSFDHIFHELHLAVQPLPFANMEDTYAMINGRGYPDTADARTATFPASADSGANPDNPLDRPIGFTNTSSQQISSLITANVGQRILLRLSNLNVTNYYTVTALGLPMQVIGQGSKLLRGPTGNDLYYYTTSITLGGGEATDVIIDTAGVAPGTYFLYTTNFQYLSNFEEDFGGMMTEIHIN